MDIWKEQAMITRTITNVGLVNISRQVRGPKFEGKVVLSMIEGGILLSAFNPEATYPETVCITKFDQYNRIRIPTAMKEHAGINRRINILLRLDGTIIITPASTVCAICGSGKELEAAGHNKYICKSCKKKI